MPVHPVPEQTTAALGRAQRGGFAAVVVALVAASCLFLQRIGVPFGEFKLHLATLVTIGLIAIGMIGRRVLVDTGALLFYLAFVAVILAVSLLGAEVSGDYTIRRSIPSMLHTIALYAPFVFRAHRTIPSIEVFRIVQRQLLLVAGAGIAQFALQFVGFGLFTFQGLVPDDFLAELGYNVVIPVREGDAIYKSNGFFLLEPSVFSQMMAIAIMLEILYFKRFLVLAALGLALLTAVSGTGLMVLGVFFGLFVLTGGVARMSELALVAIFGALFLVLVTLVFPELGEVLTGRSEEITSERSSGYLRFVTPFLAMAEIDRRYPFFLLTGVGPGSSEWLQLGFDYNLFAPLKIVIEYGLPVLVLWLGLLLCACYRREWRLVFWPTLFLFFVTGQYLQLGPIVFMMFALFSFAADRSPRAAS